MRDAEIRHYTAEELAGLSCQELSQKHEEVIFAYHDAEIAHKRRTGEFHDDLGLPQEDVLPFVIVMQHVMQQNGLRAADVLSGARAELHWSPFFSEASGVCASNPSRNAVDMMEQAAMNLNLIDAPATR